jgi:hypothetical protein
VPTTAIDAGRVVCGTEDDQRSRGPFNPEWGARPQVVPTARGAHLHDIAAVVARTPGEPAELQVRGDRTAAGGQPRAEDEPNDAQGVLLADRTRLPSRDGRADRDADQLTLRVTDLRFGDLARAEAAQHTIAGQPVVDAAWCSTRSSPARGLQELHQRQGTHRSWSTSGGSPSVMTWSRYSGSIVSMRCWTWRSSACSWRVTCTATS